ncbi:hypothetical protein KSP40_PGU009489 [Platanthera guangdongensis]|uniref:Rubisco LSMT substrate-binding domain-containing protein n=1 Tax=Platanthera guangdongensis TaxID=2320717 RepID=A0ABR2LEN5_9ASPA
MLSRPYLLERHFQIRTDHQSLKHFLEQRVSSPLQQKWVTKLLGYDYEIVYRQGKDNRVADATVMMHEFGILSCTVDLLEFPGYLGVNTRGIRYLCLSKTHRAFISSLVSARIYSNPRIFITNAEKVLHDLSVKSSFLKENIHAFSQSKTSGSRSESAAVPEKSPAELLTTNKLSELACLALYLMYEKKQGKRSSWYLFIKELDRQRGRGQLAVESPLLWSEDELAYLEGSPTKAEVLGREEGIKREYNELDTVWFMAGSLFKQYPFDIPTEAFPYEIFKQAFVAVQSCVVHLQDLDTKWTLDNDSNVGGPDVSVIICVKQNVSLARRFALVPLGPPLLAYKSNCKAMLKADQDFVQLVVDRPYKAGEAIVVWCGPQPNSRLLLNYGLVDEDNPYDRLLIETSLNTEDPQYQDKRMVAQRNGKLAVQVFNVYVGRESEAILDMLPYLRLGYVSDPSEMHSVISSQGPICPVSPCMERAVLDQLVGYFQTRLSRYPTTLSEDEAIMDNWQLDPKKRIAARLVSLEKKMLNACILATVEFIEQLPDHTISPCPAPFAPLLK